MQSNRMSADIEKENVLRSESFRYSFRLMAYVNRERRSVFTVQAREANTVDWIRTRASREHKRWRIYSKDHLTRNVRSQIIRVVSNG